MSDEYLENCKDPLAVEIGARFNTGKLKWSLVSWKALAPMVRVLMFGAEKYDDHNWKKGFKYTEVTESLQRHLNAFIEGENDDPESKLSHVGHILCNAMFLSYMSLFRKDMDDRYIDENLEDKPCCVIKSTDFSGICFKCKKNTRLDE
tara:strand:- start:1315 stop:1758 length:444 start_codon:yes stop_codon:yes gene_type:complete